jgi:hypothetical protein
MVFNPSLVYYRISIYYLHNIISSNFNGGYKMNLTEIQMFILLEMVQQDIICSQTKSMDSTQGGIININNIDKISENKLNSIIKITDNTNIGIRIKEFNMLRDKL